MELLLRKQPQKYLASVDPNTRKKLLNALDNLSELKGDIVLIDKKKNLYRYKIPHYRIIFMWKKGEIIITVLEINSRTNIKY